MPQPHHQLPVSQSFYTVPLHAAPMITRSTDKSLADTGATASQRVGDARVPTLASLTTLDKDKLPALVSSQVADDNEEGASASCPATPTSAQPTVPPPVKHREVKKRGRVPAEFGDPPATHKRSHSPKDSNAKKIIVLGRDTRLHMPAGEFMRNNRNDHAKFCRDMDAAGLSVRQYHGRFFWRGPAVVTSDIDRVVNATVVPLQADSFGLDHIVYPSSYQ